MTKVTLFLFSEVEAEIIFMLCAMKLAEMQFLFYVYIQWIEQESRDEGREMGLECPTIEIGDKGIFDIYEYMGFRGDFYFFFHTSDFSSIMAVLCRT